jgi:hypothetical protein
VALVENRVLVRKPEGNRPLGRPMHRWEVAIKMDFKEVGREAWTGLILLRIGTGGTCERGSEYIGSLKCGEFLD